MENRPRCNRTGIAARLQFGFSDAELTEIKQFPLAALQRQAAQAETRQPSDLADQLIASLAKDEVFTHPTDDLKLAQTILANLKKEDCERALREMWSAPGLKIWLKGNLSLGKNAEQEVLDAFHASQQAAVSAQTDQSLAKWQYSDFGPAGKIAQRSEQSDLGFVQAVFENNVHVNIKQTSLEKNKLRLIVRFGGGILELPADKLGLDRLATSAFISGGLQAHTLNDLNRIVADKDVSIQFAVGEDAFLLGGGCSSNALDTQLQIVAAYLTAPGYRGEAHS